MEAKSVRGSEKYTKTTSGSEKNGEDQTLLAAGMI